MKSIIQLSHALSPGDAISSEVISLHRAFQEQGIDSKIAVIACHADLRHLAIELHDGVKLDESDGIILHYSMDSEVNKYFMNSKCANRIFRYHNVTPGEFFQSYNHKVAEDCYAGRKKTKEVMLSATHITACSNYSCEELTALGGTNCKCIPLSLDYNRLSISPNDALMQRLIKQTNILTVGRLAPNKCVHDVIKSFYFYHEKINKNSMLWIVGHDIDTEIYSFELRALVTELGLEQSVGFLGGVTDSELRALYISADCYVTMSEHEGFCAPVIEAMGFGVPVVGFHSSAVTETVGDGGVIVLEKNFPKIAETIDALISNAEIRQAAVELAKSRGEHFRRYNQAKSFLSLASKVE